jgi:heat shock protein HslJ
MNGCTGIAPPSADRDQFDYVSQNAGSKKTMRIIAFVGSAIGITMLMVSCMKQVTPPPGAKPEGIEGIQWYLTEMGGSPVSLMEDDKQPHILLDPEENQATGFAGCNNFFGSYERDGSSLTFGPMGATRMACPDLETGLETSVFKALENTRKWRQADGELLLLDGDAVLARFSQQKYMVFVGPVWQWTQTLFNDDRKVVPENPENYTVQFKEEGAISVKADCNAKGGTYSIPRGEKSISIEITRSTMAFCPEGSLEDEFVKGLSAAAIYFIQNGDLYIDLKYDSGTMRF